MQLKLWFQRFSRRFNKRIKVFSLLGFFLFFLHFFFSFFSVKQVQIFGSGGKNILGLEQLYGKNLIFFNPKHFASELISLNSYLKSVEIKKKFPSTLVLKFFLREPLAVLQAKQGYFILDKEGRLLERIRKVEREYPMINFYQKFDFEEFSPGDFIEYNEIKYSLWFLDLIESYGIKVKAVDILRGDMIRFNLRENDFGIRKIYLTIEKKLEKEETELKEVLKYLKVSGKKVREIDLRYKRPILRN